MQRQMDAIAIAERYDGVIVLTISTTALRGSLLHGSPYDGTRARAGAVLRLFIAHPVPTEVE